MAEPHISLVQKWSGQVAPIHHSPNRNKPILTIWMFSFQTRSHMYDYKDQETGAIRKETRS